MGERVVRGWFASIPISERAECRGQGRSFDRIRGDEDRNETIAAACRRWFFP